MEYGVSVFFEVVEALVSSLVALFPYGPALLQSEFRGSSCRAGVRTSWISTRRAGKRCQKEGREADLVTAAEAKRKDGAREAAAADVVENGLSYGEWFVHGEWHAAKFVGGHMF